MAKFRKKPVVIEAVRVTEVIAMLDSLPAWVHHARLKELYTVVLSNINEPKIVIKTLEGTMIGLEGDWLIRGVKGELYPCKPDIFDATYEPVTEFEVMAGR